VSQPQAVLMFVGPPGSGKGTISKRCVQSLGWVQLSTGNLCRKNIAEGTPLGKEIESAINAGKLVSDHVISTMVEEWLMQQIEQGKTVILDGYPRAYSQALHLHAFLNSLGKKLDMKVIRFILPDDVIIRRLSYRLVCANGNCQAVYSSDESARELVNKTSICDLCKMHLIRRGDDTREAVKERLIVYHKHEEDLLQFYQKHGQSVVELGSEGSSDEVYTRFCSIVGVSEP
jgi:adenylate kinase